MPIAPAVSPGAEAALMPTREDQPAAVSRVRKRPSVAPPNGIIPNHPAQQPQHSRQTSVPRPEPTANPVASSSTGSSAARAPSITRASSQGVPPPPPPAQTRHSPSYFNPDNEEEDEAPRSPKKSGSKSAARKRVLSDDEEEYERIDSVPGSSHSQEDARRTPLSPSTTMVPQTPRHEPPSIPSSAFLCLSIVTMVHCAFGQLPFLMRWRM